MTEIDDKPDEFIEALHLFFRPEIVARFHVLGADPPPLTAGDDTRAIGFSAGPYMAVVEYKKSRNGIPKREPWRWSALYASDGTPGDLNQPIRDGFRALEAIDTDVTDTRRKGAEAAVDAICEHITRRYGYLLQEAAK
ncbi:hypothetical protein [Nocardia wallacei]|uniref:hypothetical protein n=1 Tax=Nocardia wallacei TaxID=480035 RepID=UPI0024568BD7|nr:hypothetical protein [Nocardia wallacei]